MSPAYDINPVVNANGLHLNIDENDNSLDFGLAFETIRYFQLTHSKAVEIHQQVIKSVKEWLPK